MMVGYFPQPYPEELFYSVCARAAERLRFERHASFMQELFGNPYCRANVGFPFRLKAFLSNLPPGQTYAPDLIIEKHTLLPLHEPFLGEDRRTKIREEAKSDQRPFSRPVVSGGQTTVAQPAYLRCCPCCDLEDEERHGERFWRRLPQVTGVEVCPRHEVFLNSTSIARTGHRNCRAFVSARSDTTRQPARPIDPANDQHQILLRLASDAEWLLRSNSRCPGPLKIRWLNQELLVAKGYAAIRGRHLDTESLHRDFARWITPSTLNILQSELGTDPHTSWLRSIARRAGAIPVPFRQLLFIQFLGESVASFFGKIGQDESRIEVGPWPCLNPVCTNYRKFVIHANRREDHGRIGVFSCSFCCFSYSRYFRRRDVFKTNNVRYRGWLWFRELRTLTADGSVPLREIYKRLGITENALRQYAAELKIPVRPRNHSKRGRRGKVRIDPKLRKQRRCEWLEIRRDNPRTPARILRLNHVTVWNFLWRHDRDWYHKNKPKPPGNPRRGTRGATDWSARDAELAERVRQIGENFKATAGNKPKLSLRAISASLGVGLDAYYLDRLPATKAAVARIRETKSWA